MHDAPRTTIQELAAQIELRRQAAGLLMLSPEWYLQAVARIARSKGRGLTQPCECCGAARHSRRDIYLMDSILGAGLGWRMGRVCGACAQAMPQWQWEEIRAVALRSSA